MKDSIFGAIAHTSALLKKLQVKYFLASVLVGFLVLTTNVNSEYSNQTLAMKIDQIAHQNGSQRPKTIGEWNLEARETESQPGKRFQKIVGESKEALKEWGLLYLK